MSIFRTVALVLLALWLGCGSAFAEKRIALVIGNSAYRNVPRLTNPANDASRIADTFKNAGFDAVTAKLDLTVSEMRKTLRDFGASTRDADIAVIYYAGHGIELDGNNYLIPTDAALETDADVLDETLPLDRVLFAVEPAKRLRLIILDACRDNPFAKSMKRTIAVRAVGRGLAKVEPTSPNTLIAFAAKAGSTALDGDSNGSPFTTALVKHIATPGLDLRKAFGYVRDDVLKATNNKQEPYVYGSLGGDDFALVAAAKPVVADPAASGPQPNLQDNIRRDYELALQLSTREGWNAFLGQYPEGFYANLAKAQLNKIAAEEARAVAAEKARLAEEEKARLAAEGAKQAERAKAAAAVRAAEEARLAAEKAKQIEQAKADAAERTRATAEKAAAAVAKQSPDSQPSDIPKVAALSPPANDTKAPPVDLPKAVQTELKRVGCLAGAADGNWNGTSERSLALFNKYAGTKFDVKLASTDALEGIKAKTARVCPLICGHGYKANGDSCVKVTCKAGYRVGDDNECVTVEGKKPVASREEKREETRKPVQPGNMLPNAGRPSSAPSGNNRELSEHEATVRAEALYAKCKQQFGVNALGQAKTTNAGMASCIRNGGRAN